MQYSSPKVADAVTVNLAFIPGEGDTVAGDVQDGPADSFSSSIVFDNGTFYGALAYDSEMSTSVYDAEFAGASDYAVDALRAVAMVSMDMFEVGVLYQMSETAEDIAGVSYEDSSYVVSGAVKLDRLKLKAQYGLADLDTTGEELTLMAVGADYKVAKNSKVFGYFSRVETDLADTEDSTFGIGFEHKFSM